MVSIITKQIIISLKLNNSFDSQSTGSKGGKCSASHRGNRADDARMRRRRTESSKQFIRMAMIMVVMQTDDDGGQDASGKTIDHYCLIRLHSCRRSRGLVRVKWTDMCESI